MEGVRQSSWARLASPESPRTWSTGQQPQLLIQSLTPLMCIHSSHTFAFVKWDFCVFSTFLLDY